MTSAILMLFQFFINVFLWILGVLLVLLFPFAVICLIRYILFRRQGYSFKQRKILSTYHKENFFKRVFWDFPGRFVLDLMEKDPDSFPYHGIIMVVGEQGAGKTCTAVYILSVLKKMFPLVQIYSNISITFQDGTIEDPNDIIFKNNGERGCIKFLDEIQNWFNSLESANFPPEMLSEISQQRKQRSLFVGTSQQFNRISKAIREQTHYLIEPMTLFGCLTVVRVFKPTCDDGGNLVKKRKLRTFFFVQSDEIRNSYNTLEKVKRLSLKGWKSRSEQYTSDNIAPVAISISQDVKKH